jgi:hypothetical protein
MKPKPVDHPSFPPVLHHPAKAILSKHNVPLRQIAQFCGSSYNRMSTVLCGYTKPSAQAEAKLWEMVRILEDGKGKK